MDNSTLFKKLVQNAKSTSRFEYALGGNAPIMAKRMALEGHDVTLAARLSVESLDALPKNVKGQFVHYLSKRYNMFCLFVFFILILRFIL